MTSDTFMRLSTLHRATPHRADGSICTRWRAVMPPFAGAPAHASMAGFQSLMAVFDAVVLVARASARRVDLAQFEPGFRARGAITTVNRTATRAEPGHRDRNKAESATSWETMTASRSPR
jgi:hypothetical protein